MVKINNNGKEVMPMIESQSESLLPSPLKIRGVRPARRTNSLAGGGVMKLDQGFAEEKRMVPSPG
jgi:hypothetical protein